MKILVVGNDSRYIINFRGDLLKAMADCGHDVVACVPELTKDVQVSLSEFGISCHNIFMKKTAINPFYDLRTLFNLAYLFKTEKPNRILAYTIKPVLYSTLAAKLVGCRNIYSIITGLGYVFADKNDFKHKMVSFVAGNFYKLVLNLNDGVFFQNHDDLEEFFVKGILKPVIRTKVINGSGVDIKRFSLVPLPKEPSFLMISRLIIQKGIREYVNASRIVKSYYPNSRFYLAGWLDSNPDSIKKDELQEWSNEGVINYLGPLSDVRPALARCRFYVLPSYREGTPKTILEAMSMGRPIITTDVPGCRETVKHGLNGYLVPPCNSKKLAEAMVKLIKKPRSAERMGYESRRIVEERYDVHKVNGEILDFMGLR